MERGRHNPVLFFPDRNHIPQYHFSIISRNRLTRLMFSHIIKVAKLGGINRPVILGFFSNFRAIVSGLVVALLIVFFFTPEVQGFYYTFLSLISMQILAELGLGRVIIQFVSHEWAQLRCNEEGYISGSPEAMSRLVSLGRSALKWYAVGGGIFAITAGLGGYCFFLHSNFTNINWVCPWFVLCLFTGIKLLFTPLASMLEGANKLLEIQMYRLIDGVFISLTICSAIVFGAKLWTPVLASSVSLLWSSFFFGVKYRKFFAPLFSAPTGPAISWRLEVWPMQWRVGLSYMVGYFITNLFIPLLFHYHGAVIAGQMGMTWNIILAIASMSLLCVQVKAPAFGILIAKREFKVLDNLFVRVTTTAIILVFLGSITAWIGVYSLYSLDMRFANRVLPPLPTALFFLAHGAMLCSTPFSLYLQAHKKEPFLVLNVISGILIGLSSWILGKKFGAVGMASGYLAVSMFFSLPYALFVWNKCRLQWHRT